jgi:hypothetical protein
VTIQYFKDSLGEEGFNNKEFQVNCFAGLVAGVIAAALTNALECVTVTKQTNPSTNIMQMIKTEGKSLLFRGLGARCMYNGA